MKPERFLLSCLAVGLFSAAPLSHARVARIVIDKVEQLTDGSGYELLRGRAFGTLDPAAPGNSIITDLQFAPRHAEGKVEYVTTFSVSKPVDMGQASGVLHGVEPPPRRFLLPAHAQSLITRAGSTEGLPATAGSPEVAAVASRLCGS